MCTVNDVVLFYSNQSMRQNKLEMESILSNERSRSAQDRLKLHQTIEEQTRKMNELQRKLREQEIEIDETKRSLHLMEEQAERNKVPTKRLQSSDSFASHWTPTRVGLQSNSSNISAILNYGCFDNEFTIKIPYVRYLVDGPNSLIFDNSLNQTSSKRNMDIKRLKNCNQTM